ncbi:acyl-CoA dehydrogenase family protein [Pseudonocardia alni]|uniref:acyl-CoA dehydrogenase family protein n=1 Tax=Pseudonocardia alni TaxID=33907 RepID=UPI0033252EFD
MNLELSPEQSTLHELLARLVADATPPDKFAELFDRDEAAASDPTLWSRLTGLGMIGLSVSEDLGGGGAGWIEETILFEELGAGLSPSPAFGTVALCLPLLAQAPDATALVGDVLSGSRRYAFAGAGEHARSLFGDPAPAPGIRIDSTPGGLRVTGTRSWVLDGADADAFLVPASSPSGPTVLLIPADDRVSISPMPTVDPSRRMVRAEYSHAAATPLLGPDLAPAALATADRLGMLLACAEAVGISERMLATTVDYAQTRTQFGRPIGSYQAVSHQLADTYVEIELARSLVRWAAVEPNDTTVDAAAAFVLPAAVQICERAIQLHGGIGMTWDAPLHRYYKRALLLQAFAPRTTHLRERIAATLLDA